MAAQSSIRAIYFDKQSRELTITRYYHVFEEIDDKCYPALSMEQEQRLRAALTGSQRGAAGWLMEEPDFWCWASPELLDEAEMAIPPDEWGR